ncbi:MAG: peptide chain release factor N(5)-glutamine methyltransferase [Salaquimonas sp.]
MMFEAGIRLRDVQRKSVQALKGAGVENAALDVRYLLAAALKIDMARLIASDDKKLDEASSAQFSNMIEARLSGIPVHRILGYREFYGRRFHFGEGCLEPRPETELLVERVLQDVDSDKQVIFCDVGVGSGAIINTLLAELSNAKAIGTDLSPAALRFARRNAELYGVSDRIDLIETDCLEGVTEKFNFITSNPPYIRSADIESLSKEVQGHDPMLALDGGEDGLYFYRKLLREAGRCLQRNGKLYMETGHGQHSDIALIAKQMGWGIVSLHLDLSGLERIVVLQLN